MFEQQSNSPANINPPAEPSNHSMIEWLSGKEAAGWMGISTSGFYKLVRSYQDNIVEHIKTIPGRGYAGKKLFITKAGLIILGTLKNQTRHASKIATYRKQQIAEKAISNTMTTEVQQVLIAMQKTVEILTNEVRSLKSQMVNITSDVEQLSPFQQIQLSLLPPPTVEAPKMSERALIRQRVYLYAAAKNLDNPSSVWSLLYQHVYYRLGINCNLGRDKKKTGLDIIDKHGKLPETYAIACEILKF